MGQAERFGRALMTGAGIVAARGIVPSSTATLSHQFRHSCYKGGIPVPSFVGKRPRIIFDTFYLLVSLGHLALGSSHSVGRANGPQRFQASRAKAVSRLRSQV